MAFQPEEQWVQNTIRFTSDNELPEQRSIKIFLIAIDSSEDILNVYSDWRKLVRAIA